MMFKIVSLVLCFSFLAVNHGIASNRQNEDLTNQEKLQAYRAKQAEKRAKKYTQKSKAPSRKQMQKGNKGRPKGKE